MSSLLSSQRGMADLLRASKSAAQRLQCISSHLTTATDSPITEKSFPQGSACPPLSPGKLRLYSMRFCPFAQRTRLVLEYKNIPYETVNIDLMHKPDWFLKKNPIGLVPVLELDNKIIAESLATCVWLDEVYPQNQLQPTDPYEKALDTVLMEYFSNVTSVFYAFKRSKEDVEKNIYKLQKYYGFYENALIQRGGPFFGGDKPALVDFFIWPHMERIPGVIAKMDPRCAVDERYPRLFRWFESMYEVQAVKDTMFDGETHAHFLMSLAQRKPDYDYGLN